jgi:uncharacterized protein (DUF302 family)
VNEVISIIDSQQDSENFSTETRVLQETTRKFDMKLKLTLALITILACHYSTASEGLVSIRSSHSVSETIDRLEEILKGKGFKIIARIDHSSAAKKVGVDLRETELIIFGNPKVGSPLMVCELSVAIDLPQKALATRDMDGNVWLSYNDPAFLKHRHDIAGCDAVLTRISGALNKLATAAAN